MIVPHRRAAGACVITLELKHKWKKAGSDDNEFGMTGELSRLLEQDFEVAQVYAHDQGLF